MWISSLSWRPESIVHCLQKNRTRKRFRKDWSKPVMWLIWSLKFSEAVRTSKMRKHVWQMVWLRILNSRVRFHRRWRRCYALRSARLQQSWKCVCISWSAWKLRHYRTSTRRRWRRLHATRISWIIMSQCPVWSSKSWNSSVRNLQEPVVPWSWMQKRRYLKKRRLRSRKWCSWWTVLVTHVP